MRRASATVRILPLLALLGGCATLDGGIRDEVAVVTSPPGALISSSTGTFCTSPCSVSGPRRDSFVVTASKPGYVTQTAVSNAKADDAAVGRASKIEATPDVLGRLIDVQDGTFYTHDPKALVITLPKAP